MTINEYQNNEGNTILTKEQFDKIFMCISRLSDKLHVTSIRLIDSSGRIVAQKNSESSKEDPELISTLAAGCHAASKEMARLLGEKDNFKMVLHEGKNINVFISAVDENFFLVIVFTTNIALGMVRLFTKKTITELQPILSRKNEEIRMDQVFDHHFQSLLGDELDRSFKENV